MGKSAIIIGAGPAGLTAAYKLLTETDIKPIILEESNDIGGISKTVKYNGNRIDIGGHRFFSKSKEINDFWNEIMPLQGKPSLDDIILNTENKELSLGGPDPEKDDNVMLLRNRVSRIYFLRKFFDYPISLKFQTFKNMGVINTIKSGFGYLGSCIKKKEEKSLEDFYINRFGKPLYSMFFEGYTEKLWGVHPRDIAPDWGAQRVKGLSIIKILSSAIKKLFGKKADETSLIEQFYYPKKGPGQLWERVAELIVQKGGQILLNHSVCKISTNDELITSITAIDSEKELIKFNADYFISSMPIKDLAISIDKMPDDIKKYAVNLPYRDFITVGLLVNKLKIKNKTKIRTLNNIVPDCWIYIQERNVKIGRLQIFNNWSPYMVENPEETVWIGLEYFCNENDAMWNMSDNEFISFAINELELIDIIEKQDVLDNVRIKIKKAYPAYFGTYEKMDEIKNYLESFNNLYCVGRNGQHRYNNMDHSMLTSIRAVQAIQGKVDKSQIWEINTEEEYHETTNTNENDKVEAK